MNRTLVILPAHNEEAAIVQVIQDIYRSCDARVLVALSGCTDNTLECAMHMSRDGRLFVLVGPKGKGNIMRLAFNEAVKMDSQYVIMMDADATYPASAIPIMMETLQTHDACIGVRKLHQDNISRTDRIGNQWITALARWLYGFPIHDLCTGMWAFRLEVIQGMAIKSQGFTLEAELFIYLVRHRYSIVQVPIDYHPRIGDKKIRRGDHNKIEWFLVKERLFGRRD